MKKKIMLCILAVMMLTACGENPSDSSKKETPREVTHICVEEEYYKDPQKLVSDAKGIFEGKVLGVEHLYINKVDDRIVSKDDDNPNVSIYTVYDVEITKSHKGVFTDGQRVRVKILGDNKTVVFEQGVTFDEGGEYLFFINHLENNDMCELINALQASYRVDNGSYIPMDSSNTLEFDKALLDSIANQ